MPRAEPKGTLDGVGAAGPAFRVRDMEGAKQTHTADEIPARGRSDSEAQEEPDPVRGFIPLEGGRPLNSLKAQEFVAAMMYEEALILWLYFGALDHVIIVSYTHVLSGGTSYALLPLPL